VGVLFRGDCLENRETKTLFKAFLWMPILCIAGMFPFYDISDNRHCEVSYAAIVGAAVFFNVLALFSCKGLVPLSFYADIG
jgi:hypothetical protein